MDVHAVKVPAFLLVCAASAWLSHSCSSSDTTSPSQTGGAGGNTGATSGTATGSATIGTGSTSAATGATTGASGATTGTTATTGAGGATGTGGAGGATDVSPLPFIVDSLYIASGYMGDGATP